LGLGREMGRGENAWGWGDRQKHSDVNEPKRIGWKCGMKLEYAIQRPNQISPVPH